MRTMTKPAPVRAPKRRGEGVRALDRGLAILGSLGDGSPRTLSQIATALDLPYSTTHRLLETLVARDFVQQSEPHGAYAIGVRAFEIGSSYVRGSLTDAANRSMVALMEGLNETVNLAVRDRNHAIYLHQVEGRQKVRMFTRVGARVPLHCSGVGKALLAWEERSTVDALDHGAAFEHFTPNTRTTVADLVVDLDTTRATGYAVDLEEYELGVRCVAAPVRDASGRTVAALSVSAPLGRFGEDRLHAIGEQLARSAADVSRRLGWSPAERSSAN
ncbi:MAG: IclR family transcriptional regulator [Trueperaceae bacterium]|nr:IclR family transcriptional regulator [Trueperaceae bacterium]